MNQAYQNILKRRSVREFQNSTISRENIELILTAAMSAPSANCTDPWRFIVVQNKELLKKMSESLPNGKKILATCDCSIVVYGDIEKANRAHESYLLQDCSASVQNILLAARALDIGSCWIGVHPNPERMAGLSSLFDLGATMVPVAVIGLGIPVEWPQERNRYCKDFVRWE